MNERSTGTLTLANIELGGDLWMLASGTGVAPFISILRDPYTYTSFDTIHLAWSVRRRVDLNAYNNFIESMPVDFMPIVTQDPEWTGMNKRITTQLSAGTLIPNLHANNKVMVCGSMEFNTDIKTMLKDWGWTEGNKRIAGTFVQEKAYVER